MKREYQSLVHNNTWKLVLLPPNKAVVSGKWCYQAKTKAGGIVQQHKARYVARGFTQRPGVDFMKTTSPIVALTLLRSLLAIATKQDIEIKQLDVNSTFLYRDLRKEIYLKQLEGFQINRANGKKLVCKL
jgi:hypothetical protein